MRLLITTIVTIVAYIVIGTLKKERKEEDRFLSKVNEAIEKGGSFVYANSLGIVAGVMITRKIDGMFNYFMLPITVWIICAVLSLIYDKEKENSNEETKVEKRHEVKETFKSREWKKAMRDEMYKAVRKENRNESKG